MPVFEPEPEEAEEEEKKGRKEDGREMPRMESDTGRRVLSGRANDMVVREREGRCCQDDVLKRSTSTYSVSKISERVRTKCSGPKRNDPRVQCIHRT